MIFLVSISFFEKAFTVRKTFMSHKNADLHLPRANIEKGSVILECPQYNTIDHCFLLSPFYRTKTNPKFLLTHLGTVEQMSNTNVSVSDKLITMTREKHYMEYYI